MELICKNCTKPFIRPTEKLGWTRRQGDNVFCTKKCWYEFKKSKIEVSCINCTKLFMKTPSAIKKSNNRNFCCQSCSAVYSNTHKTTGTRRSKLEVYLESELPKLYPNLVFLFNDKTTINSELDIYIPSLKLAFELNGIFHYEPIYGEEKLSQIKNNDNRKYQACLEHGIELCIIDTSSFGYFKPDRANKYLTIITSIIKVQGEGLGPSS